MCCVLGVPGKETCGATEDQWNQERSTTFVQEETEKGALIVLPLATIIETGNHISKATSSRYECAKGLTAIILKAAEKKSPYVAFSDQANLWTDEELKKLANEWPERAKQQQSIGDTTIISVAEFYAQMGNEVEILTGDEGLKAYEPVTPITEPRRRKK